MKKRSHPNQARKRSVTTVWSTEWMLRYYCERRTATHRGRRRAREGDAISLRRLHSTTIGSLSSGCVVAMSTRCILSTAVLLPSPCCAREGVCLCLGSVGIPAYQLPTISRHTLHIHTALVSWIVSSVTVRAVPSTNTATNTGYAPFLSKSREHTRSSGRTCLNAYPGC